MPKFALCIYSMYKLLYIIRKSEFMDSNLLQFDTPVAVLVLVASSIAGYRPSIGA